MCGIAGAFSCHPSDSDTLLGNLRRMADAIAHRGPDDQGTWADAAAGIGFSHRRLSIIDLSPLGHQPMHSRSGRYTITFNGEIYNYRELRAELNGLGHGFRGASDTEVFLAAVEQWGFQHALVRSVGMFALGLWDRDKRTLLLARDRFGEKPLYYGIFGKTLLFGSELKALRQHAAWDVAINRHSLNLLVRHGYIPAPYTVFRQVKKLRAGHFATIAAQGDALTVTDESYWDPKLLMEHGALAPFHGTPAEAVDHVEQLLSAAIKRQLVADVPVGAFLSGGVDSSLVVSLMARQSSRPVKTFSIGFAEADLNEAPYAKAVAEHLRTDHTELTVTPRDALDVIPLLPQIYDEPFADSSQIPTYLVSKLARRSVTVSLSGDAGDELFGGYTRYQLAQRRWRTLSAIPRGLRVAAGASISSMPLGVLAGITSGARLFKQWRGRPDFADRVRDKSREMRASSAGGYFGEMSSYFNWPAEIALRSVDPPTVANTAASWPAHVDDVQVMMYQDTAMYLPDDILVKVDRAAMAVSLESRVPLLDPEVANAAWQIPSAVHFADGRGKWILRQILERHVPRTLIDRPKAGFAVPIGRWLRGELRDWATALLAPSRLERDGLFNREIVSRRWAQHLASDSVDWSFHLWTILMFQAWLETWGPVSSN